MTISNCDTGHKAQKILECDEIIAVVDAFEVDDHRIMEVCIMADGSTRGFVVEKHDPEEVLEWDIPF